MPAVPEAGKPESGRLHQGPRRARHDRGRGTGRAAAEGFVDRRGHGGKYRPGPRAGGGAEGLSPAHRRAGQDEPGKDLPPQSDGRRGGAHALGRDQGPSRVLPGPGRAARARTGRVLRQPVRQPRESEGARRDDRPGNLRADGAQGRCRRRGGGHRRNDHRPVALFCASVAAHRDGACRSGGLDRRGFCLYRQNSGQGGHLARRRHRRGLHSAGVRSLAREEGLHHPGRRSLRHVPRAAEAGRNLRRHLLRHADRRRAALLPRAEEREARGHAGLRQRQQVPVEGVQRLLDAGPGLHQARDLRRPARPHLAPPPGARRRHRQRRRNGAGGLPAHEALRRLAAPGARGRQGGRHRRRAGYPDGSHRQPGAFPRAGHRGNGKPHRHRSAGSFRGAADGDLPARHGGHRGRRRSSSWASSPASMC